MERGHVEDGDPPHPQRVGEPDARRVVREGELACNDDTRGCATASGSSHGSRLTPTVTAGRPYYIVVDGYGGAQGRFQLTVAPR